MADVTTTCDYLLFRFRHQNIAIYIYLYIATGVRDRPHRDPQKIENEKSGTTELDFVVKKIVTMSMAVRFV